MAEILEKSQFGTLIQQDDGTIEFQAAPQQAQSDRKIQFPPEEGLSEFTGQVPKTPKDLRRPDRFGPTQEELNESIPLRPQQEFDQIDKLSAIQTGRRPSDFFETEENKKKQAKQTLFAGAGALGTFMGGGGPGAIGLGLAADAALGPGAPGAQVASGAGEGVGRRAGNALANFAGKFGGGKGKIAQILAKGLPTAIGSAGGFGLGGISDEALLGKRIPTDSDGSTFFTPTNLLVGSALLGAGLGELGGKAIKEKDTIRRMTAFNEEAVRKGVDPKLGVADRLVNAKFGTFIEFFQTKAEAGKRSELVQQFVNKFFPTELSSAQLTATQSKVRKVLRKASTKKNVDPEIFPTELGTSAREALNLTDAEDKALLNFIGGAKGSSVRTEAGKVAGRIGGATKGAQLDLTMVAGLKKVLTPEEFDKFSNEWIKRTFIPAVLLNKTQKKVRGNAFIHEGGKRIVSGAQWNNTINAMGPTKINEVFGEGRAEALKQIGELLDITDPAAAFQTTNPVKRVAQFVANRMAFSILLTGSAAAGGENIVAGAAMVGAIGTITIPLVVLVKKALKNPKLAEMLLEGISTDNQALINRAVRGIVTDKVDDFGESPDAIPALL